MIPARLLAFILCIMFACGCHQREGNTRVEVRQQPDEKEIGALRPIPQIDQTERRIIGDPFIIRRLAGNKITRRVGNTNLVILIEKSGIIVGIESTERSPQELRATVFEVLHPHLVPDINHVLRITLDEEERLCP